MANQSDDETDGSPSANSERSTAPQSEYFGRDVVVGFLVALVGLLITFGIPLIFT